MALVISSSPLLHPMTTSILLRSPPHSSPSPSPSPASTPLPALQTDLSSSSSSSTSGSCLDLHRSFSARSTRRIRFAPLPDPRRDLFDLHDPLFDDDSQSDAKHAPQTVPAPNDLHDGFVALSPTVSPDSTLSSARSTPTIRTSPNTPSKNIPKSNLKLFRPFSFLRRANSSSPNRSPISQSASLPGSRNPSLSSLVRSSSSVPTSPSFHSAKLPRISTEDILTLGTKSFFRARSGSASSTRPFRTSSPPPKPSDPTKSLNRSASTGSGSGMKLGSGKRDWGEGSSQSHDTAAIAGSGPKKRRASASSALTPGAGGGRHASSVKVHTNDSLARPSTAPSPSLAPPKKHVKMLNGRVYGAKRYAAQTLANPFANVRDDPEFVEWGYGGMGSVHASAGIANDMWKGLQRSERGGALLAGSSFGSPSASTHPTAGAVIAGGGRGSGARASSPIARRKMSDSVPECGMGNVSAGGALEEEDDGSGMGWVKRRRAEREAKARLEQEAKELEKKAQEGRKSSDSLDASMYASTASTTTSLTACTSAASTDLTTPTTSPLASRSPSVTDLKLTSSPSSESRDLRAAPPRTVTGEQSSQSDAPPTHLAPPSKDEHGHHVLTAVRLSPNISSSSHKHSHSVTYGRTPSLSHSLSQIGKGTDNGGTEQVAPLSPVDTEETATSTNSLGEEEEEPSRSSNDEEEQDDVDDDEDDEAQDIGRKTALGAGVEKISRHVDVEAR